jgi:hypothetical protein
MPWNCAEDPKNPMGKVLVNTRTGQTVARYGSSRQCEAHMDALYAHDPAVKAEAAREGESPAHEAKEKASGEDTDDSASKAPAGPSQYEQPRAFGRLARMVLTVKR